MATQLRSDEDKILPQAIRMQFLPLHLTYFLPRVLMNWKIHGPLFST